MTSRPRTLLTAMRCSCAMAGQFRKYECTAPLAAVERLPITSNHVIDKESLKIKILDQVLIEKVCQLFRNLR